MSFSVELELDDGGIVTYENVVSYTVEENEEEIIDEEEADNDEPSPDEVPEDGDEEREGNEEIEDETA